MLKNKDNFMVLSQDLVEFIFSLKAVPGSDRYEIVAENGYFALEDFIHDEIQESLETSVTLANAIQWIKFSKDISILFLLIDDNDDIYDLEIRFDNSGKAYWAEVSGQGETIKEFEF